MDGKIFGKEKLSHILTFYCHFLYDGTHIYTITFITLHSMQMLALLKSFCVHMGKCVRALRRRSEDAFVASGLFFWG